MFRWFLLVEQCTRRNKKERLCVVNEEDRWTPKLFEGAGRRGKTAFVSDVTLQAGLALLAALSGREIIPSWLARLNSPVRRLFADAARQRRQLRPNTDGWDRMWAAACLLPYRMYGTVGHCIGLPGRFAFIQMRRCPHECFPKLYTIDDGQVISSRPTKDLVNKKPCLIRIHLEKWVYGSNYNEKSAQRDANTARWL